MSAKKTARRSIARRKMTDAVMRVVAAAAALLGVFFLAWILLVVFRRGLEGADLAFFTELPTPPGIEGGGLGNAILGTFLMTAIAAVIGVPLGLMGGVFLSEYARSGILGDLIRFSSNLMMGIPSIIVGLFVYTLVVLPMGSFSGMAGAVSLAIIMFPVALRTTEDMLSMVPNELREAALALGAPRWRTTLEIVFRAARTGLVTGVLLAVARVSGETAPLLFTALNSDYWPTGFLNAPTANLTVTITNYALSPYADWNRIAWRAALLITLAVLLMNITARVFTWERSK